MDLTSAHAALKSLQRRTNEEKIVEYVSVLSEQVDTKDPELNDKVVMSLKALLEMSNWECKATGLIVCANVIQNSQAVNVSDMFKGMVSGFCEENLEHKEPRVRTCVVKALEYLCRLDPENIWKRFGTVLCDVVEKSFEIDETERAQTHREIALQEVKQLSKTHDASLLAHETIGWKALETSMRGLESLVKGATHSEVECDVDILSWNGQYLVKLVTQRSLNHENRYVREVGYDLCAAIADALCKLTQGTRSEDVDAMIVAICKGLEDNWSQVRFAASVAARNIMVGLDKDERVYYFPQILPRMCLNRYYLAEGVKIYSQETWQMIHGESGANAVASVITNVVDFYCLQSNANNHAVREAACHCIAELATKVDKDAVRPHVEALLAALIAAFHDDSWPVRDAACVATGKFVCGYPDESQIRLEELFELWQAHLSDNIWSVREDSAISLGHVLVAYPEVALAKIKSWLPDMLVAVLSQENICVHDHNDGEKSSPSSPRSIAGAESEPRGIVKGSLKDLRLEQDKARNNKHSNQQMYSCGSLAPKLKRRGVGCMDHGYARPKQQWEITDGAIYLLRELAIHQPTVAETYMEALSLVAEKTSQYGFENANDLQVTLWKQLIFIAKALGKRPFKKCLESFLPHMITALNAGNQLSSSAAGQCLTFLFQYLGQGIMTARIENMLNGTNLLEVVKKSPLVQI